MHMQENTLLIVCRKICCDRTLGGEYLLTSSEKQFSMHPIVSDLADGFKIEPLSASATGKSWFM